MKSKILFIVLVLAAFAGGLLIPRPAQTSYVVIQDYIDNETLARSGYLKPTPVDNVTIYYNPSVGWLVKWDAGSSYNGTEEYYIQRLEGWTKERDLPAITILPKVEYVDREVIKEVEKVVYRNKVYREWQSVDEFTAWYNAQGFYPFFPSLPNQCVPYSERVQRVALEQGYPVSTVETSASGYYADTYIGKSYHEGNKVTIGNDIFYVESIPGEFCMVKVMRRN